MAQTLKTTFLLSAIIAGVMSFSPVSAAGDCNKTDYKVCLDKRPDCWKKVAVGPDWTDRAKKHCDKLFTNCAEDALCKDAAMKEIESYPAELKIPLNQ